VSLTSTANLEASFLPASLVFLAALPFAVEGVITFNCSTGKRSQMEALRMNVMRRNDE